MSKVLVVIVNYNGKEHIYQCLESVLGQTYRPMDIIVVDNNSRDSSVELIQNNFPGIRIIQMGYNAGWGIACNVGMAAGDSAYIVLLNNDAYLEKNCIAEMIKTVQLSPKYGSCASRILLWDEPEKTEVCGVVIYRDGSSCGRGRLCPSNKYVKIEEVFCANDCCCLYRRKMIDDIGGYDPDFFIYCDETDIGWRHQIAGWRCIYTPHAIAYHAHSKAAGSYSAFKAFHVERNRIYICIKYFPVYSLLLSFCYATYRYLYQFCMALFFDRGALARYKTNNSFAAGLWILVKAHWAAMLKFPTMWHRRQQMKRIKRLSDREIYRIMSRFGISTSEIAGYE